MSPQTRAMVAAAAHAFIYGKKVAGVHDHSTEQDLQIAAETRGDRLQGFDGDRSARFGGTLPELYDAGEDAYDVTANFQGPFAPAMRPGRPLRSTILKLELNCHKLKWSSSSGNKK